MKILQSSHQSNYQDILKVIAMATMLIDHLGLFFFPEIEIMRFIGRSAMPIFCFFAGYNFSNKPNNMLLYLGLFLVAITTLIFSSFLAMNILISIYLGQIYIYIIKKCFHWHLENFIFGYLNVIAFSLLFPITKDFFDYGTLVIAIMILGYMVKYSQKNENTKLLTGIVVVLSIFHTFYVFHPINEQIYWVLIIGILQYLLFNLINFNYQFTINYSSLSRRSLIFYYIHVGLIEIIFFFQ